MYFPVVHGMEQGMKKILVTILVFDMTIGLLLLGLYRNKPRIVDFVQASSVALETAEEQADYKRIALTFDDGPHPYYTEQLLDGLKERGVQVTFFVTGEHAKLHPDIIKRIYEEGHLIGNHTYSHMQLTAANKEEFKNQLIMTNGVIEEITGE